MCVPQLPEPSNFKHLTSSDPIFIIFSSKISRPFALNYANKNSP